MTRFALALCAIVTLVAPVVADAVDVKVDYLLETKAFKAAVAGTPLTFTLYTDAACAGAPATTALVDSDALTLIEPLKRTTPKGGAKAPATSRVEHEVKGVALETLFYLRVTGPGVVPVGGACQLQHATVNGSDAILPPPVPPTTCAPDSVQAGPGQPCVDKYEMSLWEIPAFQGALIQKVKDGTATLADLTGGGAMQISIAPTCSPSFPATFPPDGHHGAPLYAVSVPGVKPAGCLTAAQAAVACRASNKRLLTSAEWLAAGAGTVDTDTDDGATDCNTNAPGAGVGGPVPTGSRSACVSTAGTFDQIGNGREVTLDLSTSVITGLPVADAEVAGGDWDDATNASTHFKHHLEDIDLAGLDTEGVTARCGR